MRNFKTFAYRHGRLPLSMNQKATKVAKSSNFQRMELIKIPSMDKVITSLAGHIIGALSHMSREAHGSGIQYQRKVNKIP